jgi:hypothetical protein
MAKQDDDLKNYQDDLDSDERWQDRATEEETDNPAEELGVSDRALRDELKKQDFEYGDPEDDDAREDTEDDLEDEGGNDQY